MRIKTNEPQIKLILQKNEGVGSKKDAFPRDSDAVLYYVFLKTLGVDMDKVTAGYVLGNMHRKKLPSWESVSRCRRKLQEQFPELRGTNWEKRHAEQETIKQELGYIQTPLGAPGTTP